MKPHVDPIYIIENLCGKSLVKQLHLWQVVWTFSSSIDEGLTRPLGDVAVILKV